MEVIIEFEDSTQIPTNLQLAQLSPTNRLKIAGRTCVAFLMAAVLSIFIPVLHFVLVPVFLISAFVMFFIQYGKVSYIDLGGFSCPRCGGNLNQKRVFQNNKDIYSKVYCYHCRSSMKFMGSENA